MTSIVMKFDTLAWAKKLEKAGIPFVQAEAQVEMLSEVIGNNAEVIENNVCMKKDLAEIKKDILIEIEGIKGSINAQIAKWVLGVSAIQATVLVTLIRSMH